MTFVNLRYLLCPFQCQGDELLSLHDLILWTRFPTNHIKIRRKTKVANALQNLNNEVSPSGPSLRVGSMANVSL